MQKKVKQFFKLQKGICKNKKVENSISKKKQAKKGRNAKKDYIKKACGVYFEK